MQPLAPVTKITPGLHCWNLKSGQCAVLGRHHDRPHVGQAMPKKGRPSAGRAPPRACTAPSPCRALRCRPRAPGSRARIPRERRASRRLSAVNSTPAHRPRVARIGARIGHDVEHAPANATNKLRLLVRRGLPVQPAQRASPPARRVVALDEALRSPRASKTSRSHARAKKPLASSLGSGSTIQAPSTSVAMNRMFPTTRTRGQARSPPPQIRPIPRRSSVRSPSSSENPGCHPSTRLALLASRYWSRISALASSRITGSRSARPMRRWMVVDDVNHRDLRLRAEIERLPPHPVSLGVRPERAGRRPRRPPRRCSP